MKMTSARWLKNAIAVVLVGLAATGCAALRPAASLRLPYKAPQRAMHAQSRPIFASKQLVNCVESTGTPCNTTSNPGNGTQGMPAWQAFGALNSDVSELYGMFGASSHLASTGSAIAGDIVGLFALPPPVQSAPATATAGGTLAAATYYYVVTATDASGETTASNELSIATTGTTSENTISWAAVSGATGYRVYRGTAPGAENTYYAVSGGSTTSFLDTGAAGTTGSAPATDTAACSGTEYLGADGFCYASGTGNASGTVSDGSGTTTANELLLSSTTAHNYTNATTLPASAMPALTGDVTSAPGSTATIVSKVNGASLPASAGLLGTNASSQIIAAPASGVTAGSYTSADITVNAQGQVTAASNGSGSGVTFQTNGTNNASQTTLNLQTGSAVDGITTTVTNTGTGNVQVGNSVNAANLQAALVSANAQTYSPTLASGATNDWDPSGGTGIATVGFVYATPNAAGSTVDGVLAGSDKQQFLLCNAAALGTNAEYIILENQSASDTTAANRLLMAGNLVLGPQMCATFSYVAGSVNRWLVSAVANGGTDPVQPLTAGTSMTPDCSFRYVSEAVSTGTAFTINAPTDCAPQDHQRLELDITSSSSGAAAYTWNAAFVASATLALPTTGNAASKQDRFGFAYSAAKSAWVLLAYNQGF